MPINSTSPITVAAGTDQLGIGLNILPKLSADRKSLTATAQLNTTHFRAQADGTLIKIGDTANENHPDVFADAAAAGDLNAIGAAAATAAAAFFAANGGVNLATALCLIQAAVAAYCGQTGK